MPTMQMDLLLWVYGALFHWPRYTRTLFSEWKSGSCLLRSTSTVPVITFNHNLLVIQCNQEVHMPAMNANMARN